MATTPAGSAYTASTSGKNFIVWFGSPGVYDKDDKNHDQAWYNYVNPMMRIAEAGKLEIKKEDTMYWCLYSTGYNKRWNVDQSSNIKFIQEHVAKIKKYGSKDYVDHIKRRAAEFSSKHGYKIVVKEFPNALDYWNDLKKYPDKSVASVWYFGHASVDLWLELHHRADHSPSLKLDKGKNYIALDEIDTYSKAVQKKFYKGYIASKFYGCNTDKFAIDWFRLIGTSAEGAVGKMNFSIWEQDVSKILSSLETNITAPGKWVVYK